MGMSSLTMRYRAINRIVFKKVIVYNYKGIRGLGPVHTSNFT